MEVILTGSLVGKAKGHKLITAAAGVRLICSDDTGSRLLKSGSARMPRASDASAKVVRWNDAPDAPVASPKPKRQRRRREEIKERSHDERPIVAEAVTDAPAEPGE